MSFELDLALRIRGGLDEIIEAKVVADHVRVTTHCMYPSNGLVAVCVFGGRDTAMITDGGGALSEALSAGILTRPADHLIEHLVAGQGLEFRSGTICSPRVPMDAVPMAILLVANAAKEVAQWLYDHSKLKRSRDFKKVLSEFLRNKFDDRLTHDTLITGKRKQHRFANVITFRSGTLLIIDPVANEASSINARVVANLDVQQAENPLIEQRIVYDDQEDWAPSDLSLLGIGAKVIPFSRSQEVIERIATQAA